MFDLCPESRFWSQCGECGAQGVDGRMGADAQIGRWVTVNGHKQRVNRPSQQHSGQQANRLNRLAGQQSRRGVGWGGWEVLKQDRACSAELSWLTHRNRLVSRSCGTRAVAE